LPADFAHTSTTVDPGIFGGQLYIYDDGVVSFGKALPGGASVGDLSSLGDAFLAPGLNDFGTALDFVSITPISQGYSDGVNPVVGELRVQWVFDAPAGSPNIFELDLFDESFGGGKPGDVKAQFLYGSDGFNFSSSDGSLLDSNFLSVESYLPTGAVMAYRDGAAGGSNTITLTDPADIAAFLDGNNGTGNNTTGIQLTGFGLSAAVPEPATWLMMILGAGLTGAVLRGRRLQSASID